MTAQTTTHKQPVFANESMGTNAPFFDGETLLFCHSTAPIETTVRATGNILNRMRRDRVLAERLRNLPLNQKVIYRAWKLAYCNWSDKITHPIVSGFAANIPERSPAFYREGERIHLSFISGMPSSVGFRYRLYTCSGPDLAHLDPPQPLALPLLFFGFVSPLHICWGAGNIVQLTDKTIGNSFRLETDFYRVASVTFLAEDPSKLLITGLINRAFEYQTILYDLETGNTCMVSVGGPVYKSSMYGKGLVFAQKQNEQFEERELYYGDYTLSPSTVQISRGE